MTQPQHGYVDAGYLSPLTGGQALGERNTAAAFNALVAAHPEVHTNGKASGYWNHDFSVDVHEHPGNYNISPAEAARLSPVGVSPHELGTRLNFSGCTAAVARQFGFVPAGNTYTWDYLGPFSWASPPNEYGLSTDTIAHEVLKGIWGNGPARKADLIAHGYDPAVVQARVNELLGLTPVSAPPAVTTPSTNPTSTPSAPVITSPTTPTQPTTPTPPKVTPVTNAPKPLTDAQRAAAVAELQADVDSLGEGATAPLSGLLAANPVARKRAYVIYAALALVVSFGPDVVTYGVVTGSHVAPFVSIIGLATSVVLKVGAAFGLVAASNAK